MKKDNLRYQSIDVEFPKKIWVTGVWLVAKDGTEMTMCVSLVKKSKTLAIKNGKEVVSEIRKKFKASSALDDIILVPLTFSKLYPLKKEYWQDSDIKLMELDKSLSFAKSLVSPDFYYLLITPTRYLDKGNKIDFTAAFAFKREDEEMLPEMMKASDHPVCPEAKNAAIYEMGEAFAYDLLKKKEFVNEKYLRN